MQPRIRKIRNCWEGDRLATAWHGAEDMCGGDLAPRQERISASKA